MGFEPTVRYKRTQHFQCCALNHLDHLSKRLKGTCILYHVFRKMQAFFEKNSNLFEKKYTRPKSCQYYQQRRQVHEGQTTEKSGYHSRY